MGETTVRNVQAQRKLREWSQRVAECRSSGLSVTQWCAEHEIKRKRQMTPKEPAELADSSS